MRAAAIPPVLMAAAALAPGACGAARTDSAAKFSGPKKDVAKAVDDLVDAASRRDQGKICNTLLTPQLKGFLAKQARRTRRGATCSDELKDSLQDIDSLDMKVQAIAISGTTATVTVKTNVSHGVDPVNTLVLVNQRGWRLSRLP